MLGKKRKRSRGTFATDKNNSRGSPISRPAQKKKKDWKKGSAKEREKTTTEVEGEIFKPLPLRFGGKKGGRDGGKGNVRLRTN